MLIASLFLAIVAVVVVVALRCEGQVGYCFLFVQQCYDCDKMMNNQAADW